MDAAEADYQNMLPQLDATARDAAARLMTAENASFRLQADALISRFNSLPPGAERAQAWSDLQTAKQQHKDRLDAADAIPKTYDRLLAKMEEAHKNLWTLAHNPTDDQERQMAEAAVMNIVTIAADLFKLYSAFA